MKVLSRTMMALGAFSLFSLIFGTTPLVSGLILDIFYIHPVSWLLVFIALGFYVYSAVVADSSTSFDSDRAYIPLWIGIAITVFWVIWLGIQNPIKMVALYKHTQYVETPLIPQQTIRPIAYTIAASNFNANQPDSRQAPGDLDYVQDHWTASIDPINWNTFTRPTQGLYLFTDDNRVEQVIQPFTFAERGWLWNSAVHTIRAEEYFVEFSDVLYVRLEDGKYIAVSTLIKRAGFARYPYIWGVAVIDDNGFIEILSPDMAEADPRLKDIALVPEKFEKLRDEAYGWRNGVLAGMFGKRGRVEVQSSTVNDENEAPFHMKSVSGNAWYTPLSPYSYGGNSGVGLAISSSHDIGGPVGIWMLPVNTSFPGADFLVSFIESAPTHRNTNWFRTSSENKCGNVTILELSPIIRLENGQPRFYAMGYVSSAPTSTSVMFYTFIDPFTNVVYEDIPTVDRVNAWLRGEFEIFPVSENSASIAPQTQCKLDDLTGLPDQSLIDYLSRITEELDRRLGQ